MDKAEREAKALQRRRLRAGRLLQRGVAQAEVARRVGVTRTTVSEWNAQLQAGGLEALKRRPRGRPSGLDEPQRRELMQALRSGALAEGFPTDLWTLPPSRKIDRAALCARVQREPSVAHSRLAGFLMPTTLRASAGARRDRDQTMEANTLAGSKKNAAKQGRIIVFIDESGLSERPTRVRTWAPRGETPVLQYHFNWHQLSVIAGITFRRFYFRLFPGAIKGPQIIEFLTALGRQIRKPLLVIWDGLPAHRSALVREYLEALKGAIQIEQLPAYAPELNPTEYIWGHLKHHELANRCAGDFADLKTGARNRLRSMQRRPSLIRAFWHQAELPL